MRLRKRPAVYPPVEREERVYADGVSGSGPGQPPYPLRTWQRRYKTTKRAARLFHSPATRPRKHFRSPQRRANLATTGSPSCVAFQSILPAALKLIFAISVSPPAITLACAQANPVSVPGGSDGAATISISGGTAPYTLLWAGPAGGTQNVLIAGDATISNLPAGVYILTVTDDNGCSESCNFTISTTGCLLDIAISGLIAPCFGAENGQVFVSANNATGMLEYDWNVDSLDGSALINDLSAGFYAVTVTDEAGCTDTASVTLTTPPLMDLELLVLNPASGPGMADGSAQITFGNGTPPYQIQILTTSPMVINSDTAGTIVLNGLLPGLYGVILTDALGCPIGNSSSFIICGDLELTLTGQSESCPGSGDGSASVVVSGGLDPFSFVWSTTEVAVDSIENLVSDTYAVTVTDAYGVCTATDSIALITVPLSLMCGQQSPVSTPVATDGEASVIVEGGTGPYTLDWSGAASGTQVVNLADTVVIGGLAAGIYSLTVTDANGCTETCSFTIAAPGCNISATAIGQNETCPGSLNGNIELTVTGGTLPFTFDWSDDALDGTEDPMGLSPGTYSVTVTDGAGCLALATATLITQNALPGASLGAGASICEDDCFDFALSLTGTAPFTVNYEIDAGSGPQPGSITFAGSTGIISVCPSNFNLTSGSIMLLLTGISDANCSNALSASASVSVNPHSAATVAPTLCPGESIVVNGNTYDENRLNGIEVIEGVNPVGCDSIITVNISFFQPAVGSYTETLCAGEMVTIGGIIFDESNPSGTAILPNASVNGCDSSIFVSLSFIQPVATNLSPTLCPGETVVVNGNTYDENMPSGQETLVSALGCDSIVTIALNYFPASVNNLSQTLCEGEQLVVNGTVYDQNNPAGTEIIVGGSVNGCDSSIVVALQFVAPVTENLTLGLCNSEFIVVNGTVYDQSNPSGTELIPGGSVNGCDSTIVVALSFFPEPTTTLNPTLCIGEQLVVNGILYNESNPSGTELLQTVNGCDSTVVINLTFHPLAASQINPTLCFGESLTVNGTVYNGNNPSGTEIIPGGAVTGCDSTVVVDLSFSLPVTAAIAGNASICNGSSATLTFQLLGETAFNVTYSNGIAPPVTLNNISNGETITVSPGVTTTYTILSATAIGNPCPVSISGSATVSISNLAVQGQVTSDYQGFGVSCPGSEDGSAMVLPLGGLPPYTYLWSDGQTSAEAEGLGAATYTVTLTDAGGCMGTASVTLIASPGVTAAVSGISPLCFGDRDGSILIESLSGGSGPYSFSMDGNVFQTIPSALPFTIANLGSGVYDLVIRDVNGCTTSVAANVVAPEELMLDLGDDRTIKLGDSTLIRAQVNFDVAQLQWTPTLNLSTPDQTDSYANPQESTAYRLTALDANGCSATDVVMIFVDATRSIYIPNIFSPNGDGINDLFTVFAGKDVLEIKGFLIFDRWVNMLSQNGPFQPNDLQYGWDGTFEGREMNAGVYVYYAEVVFVDGRTEVFKGDVTLMR
ncbi:MAG: gliding motility-associated C-terminal domain-containing protein [Saprospiraceae bacterium]|nr:gliding motility-associated C-terminal domain-containing protein [Saprospiraceae bacterium]